MARKFSGLLRNGPLAFFFSSSWSTFFSSPFSSASAVSAFRPSRAYDLARFLVLASFRSLSLPSLCYFCFSLFIFFCLFAFLGFVQVFVLLFMAGVVGWLSLEQNCCSFSLDSVAARGTWILHHLVEGFIREEKQLQIFMFPMRENDSSYIESPRTLSVSMQNKKKLLGKRPIIRFG